MKQTFLECYLELATTAIEETSNTPKIANELVDKQKLQYVDKVLKGYLKENQPSTITDIARLIQVSQTCYHKVSAKDKK